MTGSTTLNAAPQKRTTAPAAVEESRVVANGAGVQAVRAMISQARRPQTGSAWGSWLCAATSAALWYCSFYPVNWGPAAFLAPCPLLILAQLPNRPRQMYAAVYLSWAVATLAAIYWMAANGPMVPAWIALSLYMAAYAPAFLLATRTATLRLHVPLVLAAPVIWAGLELLRAHLMTGFAWYYLGHTQWRWTTLIQISDLVGVYGVSFVVVAVAASMAIFMPGRLYDRLRLLPSHAGIATAPPVASPWQKFGSVLLTTLLMTAALGYGAYRLSGEHFTPGPRVALIQGNFPSDLGPGHSPGEVFQMQNRLTGMAAQYQPNFVIWPESAYRWPLFVAEPALSDLQLRAAAPEIPLDAWKQQEVQEILGDLATQANAGLMTGLTAYTANKTDGFRRYNSVLFAQPELGVTGRYDKRHRVIFGEYVPLRDELPFLAAATPFTAGFGIDAGRSSGRFEHAGYTVAPLICYEDTVPHLVRADVARANRAGDPIDVLVNPSNDGWFANSPQQEQHLVTGLFRAVELRTPLVRAANTGVSAVIDGDGRLVEPVAFLDGETRAPLPFQTRSGRFTKNVHAALIADVPLDTRDSLYARFGDWFAGLCAVGALFCLAWSLVPRRTANV